jgi:hypothetical protein
MELAFRRDDDPEDIDFVDFEGIVMQYVQEKQREDSEEYGVLVRFLKLIPMKLSVRKVQV